MTENELSWAAGLFEGEGTIAIVGGGSRPYTRIVSTVSNNDLQIIMFFVDRWPGQFSLRKRKEESRANDTWVWTVSCQKAKAFILDVLPFIRTKRVRIKMELALKVQATRRRGTRKGCIEYRKMQDHFKIEMHKLNHRGKTPALHLQSGKLQLTDRAGVKQ